MSRFQRRQASRSSQASSLEDGGIPVDRLDLLRRSARGLAILLLVWATVGSPSQSLAQVPSATDPPSASEASGEAAAGVAPEVSTETLEQLAETLENEQARARLVEQLRALAAARAQEEAVEPGLATLVVDAVSEAIGALTTQLGVIADELAQPQLVTRWIERQVSQPERRAFWIETGLTGLAVVGVGLLAGALIAWISRRPRHALESRTPETRWGRLPPLLARTAIELAPIAGFAAASILMLIGTAPEPGVRRVVLILVEATVVARGVAVAARAGLAPLAPGLRLIPMGDDSAAYAYVWIVRLGNWAIYGAALVGIAKEVGVSAAGAAALAHAVGLAFVLLIFVLLLQSRERVAAMLRGPAEPPANAAGRVLRSVRRVLADTWHVLATVYLVAGFSVWVLDLPGGFGFLLRGTLGSVLALGVGAILSRTAGRGVKRLFRVSQPLRDRYPDLERRTSRYQPVARGALSAIVWTGVLLAALAAWGVDAGPLLTHDTTRVLITALARIALISLLGLVAWEAAQLVIERLLGEGAGGAASSGHQSARIRTLLPLARSALLIVIVTFVSMSVLAELGVDIGPLIAGAGIVGLAVGFGAQTLVKDVITGVFILLEDAISVGDLVEVAGHTGVVEAINIRSIRHRDLSGVLHTVPFSVVDVVRNLSKDFSYYLTDVGVAYREDTDECVEIMREVVEEMRADPEWGPRILEPLEFMGIQGFGDSAVAVRVRIKTRPIEQFPTGREFNRRLKQAFDARGIEIPFPHRTLYFGVDKEGGAPAGRLRIEGDAANGQAQDAANGETKRDANGEATGDEGAVPSRERGDPASSAERESGRDQPLRGDRRNG